MSMTREARKEVEGLLRSGQKDRAVQYLNNTFNISLQDATLLVGALEQELAMTPSDTVLIGTPSTTLDGPLKAEVARLLTTRRKLDAVKYIRKNLNVGLKEALILVEEVARESDPGYVSFNATGCLRGIAKGLGWFFAAVALMFFVSAGLVYYFQSVSISNSDLVTGTVTELQYLEDGNGAPVIEYELNGVKRSQTSGNYSSPPDYHVGQTVPVYVDRQEPENIIIDTYLDRYALLVGLGIFVAFSSAISMVFLYLGRRKF